MTESKTESNANLVKERLVTDLQQAKSEGSLRANRIREIVQEAVSQTVGEVKAGATELNVIARSAISTVTEVLGQWGKAADEEIAASVEGVVEGIRKSQSAAIAKTEAEIQQLQTQLDEQHQQIEDAVGGALVEIESTGQRTTTAFQDRIRTIIEALREREEFATLRQQYARLQVQVARLDDKLSTRYGDRYTELKRNLETAKETAKSQYEQARVRAEASGVDPIQQKQAEVEQKLENIGAMLARKEQQLKESLKGLLQTAFQR